MKFPLPALTALVAGLPLCVSAVALPPVMDRVPTEAMVTITIPKLSGFEKDVTNLTTMLGLPGQGMGFETVLQMIGVEKGFNLDGSLAVCLFAPAGEGEPPAILVFVPTAEYKELVGNFGVEAKENGIDTVMIQGDEVFARNIGGGFAAMSNDKARVQAFTGEPGKGVAHKKMLGARAEALCDASDLFVMVNTAVARPVVEKAVADQMERMKEGEMGDNLPPGAAEMGPQMVSLILSNTTAVVAGFDASSAGVALDLAFACTPEGEFGTYLKAAGKSSDLLSRLPGGQYLVAAALDTSSPDLKALARKLIGMVPREQMGDNAPQVDQMLTMIEKIDGQAGVIGFAPGGLSSGLFSQTISFALTKDPMAVPAMTKAQIDAITKSDQGTGKYEEAAADVAGMKVDTYEIKHRPSEENAQLGPILSSLFGPSGGPTGYVARVEGGAFTTFAKNSKLMAEALKASKGENPLSKDAQLAAVASKLPKGRIAELYLGPKAIWDTAKPFAGLAMPQLGQVEIPKNLPPIGLGIAPGDSTLQASIFLPAPVLKFIFDTAQTLGMDGGMPDGDGGQNEF